MLRLVTSFALLLLIFFLAAFIYRCIETDDSRYDVFDLLKRKPVQAQILSQGEVPRLRAKPLNLNNTALLEQVNQSLSDLTDAVVPSVVSIDTATNVDVSRFVPTDPFGFFGYQKNERTKAVGLGSGVIVSADGYIITNHHVVAGVDEITVTLHGGAKYEADWIGSDPHVDVAVLKIREPRDGQLLDLQPLVFGDSDQVRVGEMVLAVGNPFGLSETVTRGIVSAKQRQISDGTNEYFQVDAVINPGNSGGPLVNVRGEIIGINVAIFTGQSGVKSWNGVSLAIPANEARAVFEAIVYGKPLLRGSLGIGLTNVTRNYALALGLTSLKGAIVTQVEIGSPAEIAGLKPGDVIIKFDGKEMKNAEDTFGRIRVKEPNELAELTIVRKGKVLTTTSNVQSKSDTNALKLKSDITNNGQAIAEALGLQVRDLSAQERNRMGFSAEFPAVLITAVKPGSQAEKRFLAGDLIHRINRDNVSSVEVLFDILGALPNDKASIMVLSRNGQQITAVLNP